MRAITAVLLLLATICLAPAWASARPPLRAVPAAGGWRLDSDGERDVALGLHTLGTEGYGHFGAVEVLDTVGGFARTFQPQTCGERVILGQPQVDYLQPGPISHGRFLQYCAPSATHTRTMTLTSIRTGTSRTITYPGALYPVGLGSTFVKMFEAEPEVEKTRFFNLNTGAITTVPESYVKYVDLDKANPSQPLCPPVRRASELLFTKFGSYRVPGPVEVSGHWVVMERGSTLIAWRCGAKRPHILSRQLLHFSAQFGAGIVTWLSHGSVIHALDLRMGRHLQWTGRYGFSSVVHTANALYAVENCPIDCEKSGQSNRVVMASLNSFMRR